MEKDVDKGDCSFLQSCADTPRTICRGVLTAMYRIGIGLGKDFSESPYFPAVVFCYAYIPYIVVPQMKANCIGACGNNHSESTIA